MAGLLDELTKDGDGADGEDGKPHKKSVMAEFEADEPAEDDTMEGMEEEVGNEILSAIESKDPKALYEALEKIVHAK